MKIVQSRKKKKTLIRFTTNHCIFYRAAKGLRAVRAQHSQARDESPQNVVRRISSENYKRCLLTSRNQRVRDLLFTLSSCDRPIIVFVLANEPTTKYNNCRLRLRCTENEPNRAEAILAELLLLLENGQAGGRVPNHEQRKTRYKIYF